MCMSVSVWSLLHGLEQGLAIVLERHDELQLGATGFHGCLETHKSAQVSKKPHVHKHLNPLTAVQHQTKSCSFINVRDVLRASPGEKAAKDG